MVLSDKIQLKTGDWSMGFALKCHKCLNEASGDQLPTAIISASDPMSIGIYSGPAAEKYYDTRSDFSLQF
jgi:DNA-binding LacI/PurR family transcriptional regulator